jgi:hypothetical protein
MCSKPLLLHSYATDPVATVIESHLGRDELKTSPEAGGIRLSFADATARAENYDLALLRLANVLLDDVRYKNGLVTALRSEKAMAAAHAQGFQC